MPRFAFLLVKCPALAREVTVLMLGVERCAEARSQGTFHPPRLLSLTAVMTVLLPPLSILARAWMKEVSSVAWSWPLEEGTV